MTLKMQNNGIFYLGLTLLTLTGFLSKANAAPVINGDYIDSNMPDTKPEIFAKGIVSTDEYRELNAVFSPDGREFYFSRQVGNIYKTFRMSRLDSGAWTTPAEMTFFPGNNKWDEVDIWIAPDNSAAYFISNKPAERFAPKSVNIWKTIKQGKEWLEPTLLPEPINSDANEIYPTVLNNGVVYFTSSRGNKKNNRDVYRATPLTKGGFEVNRVPEPISSPHKEGDVYVSANETFMILTRESSDGLGGADLYLAFQCSAETWSEPVNLGAPVNSAAHDYTPVLSPDGRYFFFTRNGDIYWVQAKALGLNHYSQHCPNSE